MCSSWEELAHLRFVAGVRLFLRHTMGAGRASGEFERISAGKSNYLGVFYYESSEIGYEEV